MLYFTKKTTFFFLFLVSITLASCGSKRVSRIDSNQETNLSGKWNDSDSRLVAEEMITDVLKRPWIGDFKQGTGKKPKVIIGRVLNKSHEHIAIQTFTNDLERAMINSGKVKFVASESERMQLRSERADQVTQAGPAGKKRGQEAAADFMLKGTLNSILDELQGTKVVFYQIDLTLININTNEKVWVGSKKIKKIIDRDNYKW